MPRCRANIIIDECKLAKLRKSNDSLSTKQRGLIGRCRAAYSFGNATNRTISTRPRCLKKYVSTRWAPRLISGPMVNQSLPPTSEAFTENVHICHIQVAIWKAALIESPPEMDSTKYGWELDHLESLDNPVPRTVPSGTLSAPPDILQVIHCKSVALQHVAARKLSARSSVCVKVRKPVKSSDA